MSGRDDLGRWQAALHELQTRDRCYCGSTVIGHTGWLICVSRVIYKAQP